MVEPPRGLVSAVPGYATGVAYEAHGALRQMTLGNARVAQTCFNFNSRMQTTVVRQGAVATDAACSNSGTDQVYLRLCGHSDWGRA